MYAINPDLCTFCKKCVEECPTGAIVEGKAGDKDVCVVTSECIRAQGSGLQGLIPTRTTNITKNGRRGTPQASVFCPSNGASKGSRAPKPQAFLGGF